MVYRIAGPVVTDAKLFMQISAILLTTAFLPLHIPGQRTMRRKYHHRTVRKQPRAKAAPIPLAEEQRRLVHRKGSRSCRSISGRGVLSNRNS